MNWYIVNFYVDPYKEVQHMMTLAPSISKAIDQVIDQFMQKGIIIRPEGAQLDMTPIYKGPQPRKNRRVGFPNRKRREQRQEGVTHD